MARGKNINIYLMDGNANGRIKATISNWIGLAFKIPRDKLDSCRERDEFTQSSVYFLFGKKGNSVRDVVYIGQAGIRKNGGGILARLMEHDKNPDKDYWTEAVVFTTSNNIFGPTELSYLEHYFCSLAVKAGVYEVQNANDPTPGNITEEKESELDEFADYAELILGVLGYKIFDRDIREKPEKKKDAEIKTNPPVSDVKIGEFAQSTLFKLFSDHKIPFTEVKKLTNLEYCKRTFEKSIYYPILVESPSAADDADKAFVKGRRRYYADISFIYDGHRYLLCSQWFKETYPFLLAWIERVVKS